MKDFKKMKKEQLLAELIAVQDIIQSADKIIAERDQLKKKC